MNEPPLPAIHADPGVMRGVPVFAGSRLPIRTLLACVDAGEDWERLVKSWPFLTPAHIEAARRYLDEHPGRW
ncbi:DUF433 domain-containing protein [uncultured Piscinibacter sp.]|mgnify:CR=1 FL=1|uniref:DUF433 domain-containing protein n=1 Tax=uncultured Piscinibacter sp. TaxID=1131835 RepID=UPI0026118CD8|nr:DUF433 domain-containing protein [uncultured Piscinibacter sp.]